MPPMLPLTVSLAEVLASCNAPSRTRDHVVQVEAPAETVGIRPLNVVVEHACGSSGCESAAAPSAATRLEVQTQPWIGLTDGPPG